MKRIQLPVVLLAVLLFSLMPLTAEDAKPDFGLNFSFGTDTFLTDGASSVTYTKLAFQPELTFGKIGIGLDLIFHYRLNAGVDENQFEWRVEDYWPADNAEKLSAILSKIQYIKYGQKGEDIYGKIGSFEDGQLGNGFILSGFSNTIYKPDIVMTGAALDIDGNLFDFPLIGLETFVNDLTTMDVLGGRFFVRPLTYTELAILKDLQIGITAVVDRDPYRFSTDPDPAVADLVTIWGVDFRQPIISNALLTNAIFGDVVFENKTSGLMLGTGGTLISLFSYGAQLRYLNANFIPTYFDASYDIERPLKYAVLGSSTTVANASFGYFAYLGTSLLEDQIKLNILIDGPVGERVPGAVAPDDFVNYPHMTGVFEIAEGLIPYASFEAYYDKKYIRDFASLFSLEGALIGAKLNIRSGPVVASVLTDVKYNPETNDFDVTSGLETKIEF